MKLFFQIIFQIFLILTILAGCATTEVIKENDPVVLNKQGVAFIEEGQYDRAIAYFNKAKEISPSNAEAYNNRGVAYNKKGRYGRAISDFNKAIELIPRYDKAYNNRGLAYYNKGQYDKAISDFNKALELNPRYDKTYFNRGLAYDKKGRYGRAISDFNKALNINPRYFKAYNEKAWILATCPDTVYRDGAKAVELAKKAVELDQKAMSLDTLAAAYAEAGKFEEAILTQEKVIDLLKKEGKPRNLIDQCVQRLKSYKAHKPWREN
jgi:tetratricopeptide (TPR) repeat protein